MGTSLTDPRRHIRCSKCGESWDIDSLHDETETRLAYEGGDPQAFDTYDEVLANVRQDFNRRGCEAFGFQHNEEVTN
jgi:hypothetical protein